MSYDFELYTRSGIAFRPPATAPDSNVALDGPYKLAIDDIPENYRRIVGARRSLFRIHLEGRLNRRDRKTVDTWLTELVTFTKGVLINLQTEEYQTPLKSGTLGQNLSAPADYGSMSFYFLDGERFYENGLEDMLNCIAKVMPEALPVRYGHYEPLQGKLESNDFSNLLAAFREATDMFMKSPAPFGHIYLSIPCRKTFAIYHPQHFIRREFLVGCVSFELRQTLFANHSKLVQLRSLFSGLCLSLDVIYAVISQREERGAGWQWFGVPNMSADTVCVGPQYKTVWPEFERHGEPLGPRHHIISADRFGNAPPQPPAELAAPDHLDNTISNKHRYARVFPFDYEFSETRYIW